MYGLPQPTTDFTAAVSGSNRLIREEMAYIHSEESVREAMDILNKGQRCAADKLIGVVERPQED